MEKILYSTSISKLADPTNFQQMKMIAKLKKTSMAKIIMNGGVYILLDELEKINKFVERKKKKHPKQRNITFEELEAEFMK